MKQNNDEHFPSLKLGYEKTDSNRDRKMMGCGANWWFLIRNMHLSINQYAQC
jgi:hypothetical protein